jgi:primosomal protein N' (replication factor Y)
MHYYEVAPNIIVRAGSSTFTYHSDQKLAIGQVVEIEIGSKSTIGVIFKESKKPTYPTKLISNVIEAKPLPKQLVDLATWMSGYYRTPLATVLQTILPRGLKTKRRKDTTVENPFRRERTNFVLNKQQKSAVEKISSSDPGTILLQGITGSGKTEVYIRSIKKALDSKRSAIVLVPEISLTPQLVSELANHFDNLVLTHSKMTEAQRHAAWKKVLNSSEPVVVVGPRSALFTPVKNLGIIVIDECHEPSFKQESAPRYSALRSAGVLGRLHQSKVILGSATPLVSDRFLAEQNPDSIIKLDMSARKLVEKPDISLIDMTKKESLNNHWFLSDKLLKAIDDSLEAKSQVLIFHNRRGTTNTTLCKSCGWYGECPRCFVPTTLHADKHQLICHICDYKAAIPLSCPVCSSVDIIHKGVGTKLIETELARLFPKAKIARFDNDNNIEESLASRYEELYDGSVDIIIGTQTVAKGLDLPNLRTIGVVQADAGLALPDYSSEERVFQLISQVVGRVGRSEHASQVVVQSYQIQSPSVHLGIKQDYESFYKHALSTRKSANFPPYTHLLKLTCIYKTEAACIKNAKQVSQLLREKSPSIEILGPTPAFYERRHDTYRWQLVLKSPKRAKLIETLTHVPNKNWQYELDPISLL